MRRMNINNSQDTNEVKKRFPIGFKYCKKQDSHISTQENFTENETYEQLAY